MKVSYHDQKNKTEDGKQNLFDEITAKSLKIIRTHNGINIEMEFSEKDAEGKLSLTLNQPDVREFPKQTAKKED